MDAGRFDTLTAYAAINTFKLDDLRPHIYKTHDGGLSWTRIVNGIPDGGITNVVREDPVRPGLLYAGTEQAVYTSLDDGEHWSSLRLNMPATSIRDLVVKDNDLAVGTHGRSFWILDDVSPLRQLSAQMASAPAALFEPGGAWRVRWNRWTDTPLPQEEPAGENPPDGAILYYWLGSTPETPVVLEILNEDGRLVRRYASDDPPEAPLEGQNVPPYWIRPFQPLPAEAGMHRFIWDLHYPPPAGARFSYPISAIPWNTAPVPTGPWVMPGRYTVRLTVDGVRYTQSLEVKMDPRVDTPAVALRQQYDLSMALYEGMAWLTDAAAMSPGSSQVMMGLHRDLSSLYGLLQGSDGVPTSQVVEGARGKLAALEVMKRGPGEAPRRDLRQDLQPSIQAVLDAFHAGGTFPGASAAVSLPDGSVITLTAGEADTVRHLSMTPDGKMLQGSVGKSYFAALAVQLIGEGRLDLEAPASRYLGGFDWYARIPNAADVTVRHLMTHTSGVMRYEFKEAFTHDLTAQPDKHWRPEELVAYVLDEEPSFPAGEGWEYSDTNFILLGMIMEEITGRPCYELIRERILEPLALTHTLPSDSRSIPGLIQGYAGPDNPFGGTDEVLLADGRFVINPQFEWAGGGFASTSSDLARWARALYTGDAFDPALLPMMLDGVPARLGPGSRYGLGVILTDTPAGPAQGHSGFFPGYLTEMAYFPELDVAVALQVNTSVGQALGRSPKAVLVALAQAAGG